MKKHLQEQSSYIFPKVTFTKPDNRTRFAKISFSISKKFGEPSVKIIAYLIYPFLAIPILGVIAVVSLFKIQGKKEHNMFRELDMFREWLLFKKIKKQKAAYFLHFDEKKSVHIFIRSEGDSFYLQNLLKYSFSEN